MNETLTPEERQARLQKNPKKQAEYNRKPYEKRKEQRINNETKNS
jgi:hypothetical protein